jgi:hypothetical protein
MAHLVSALAAHAEHFRIEPPELEALADVLRGRGKRLRRWLTTGDTPAPDTPLRPENIG